MADLDKGRASFVRLPPMRLHVHGGHNGKGETMPTLQGEVTVAERYHFLIPLYPGMPPQGYSDILKGSHLPPIPLRLGRNSLCCELTRAGLTRGPQGYGRG